MASARDTTPLAKAAGKRKQETAPISPPAMSSKKSRIKVMSWATTVSQDDGQDSDSDHVLHLPRFPQTKSVFCSVTSEAINVDDSESSDSGPGGKNTSVVQSKPSPIRSARIQEHEQPLSLSETRKIPSIPNPSRMTGLALSAKQVKNQHTGIIGTSLPFIALDAASVRRGIQEGGSTSSRSAQPKNGTHPGHQIFEVILMYLYVSISSSICLRRDSLLPAS
jgi:hypothetical protein